MWNKTSCYSRPGYNRFYRPDFQFKTGGQMVDSIPANIQKNSGEIILALSLPSYDKSEISVKLEDQELTVSTNPQGEPVSYTHQEFKKAKLKRVFRVPSSVIQESIEAKFENGILTIILRKKPVEQSNINTL